MRRTNPHPTPPHPKLRLPAGVYSHVENLQPLIGAACEALGIKNNPHKAYQIARNKFLARKVLGDAGLATTKVGYGSERAIW